MKKLKLEKKVPIVQRKIFQLENGKYFQSELINWEMIDEEEVDKTKHKRSRERACGQKYIWSLNCPTGQN